MRGSTPLDVAAASCIDNNELALALQEQDLEMVNVVKKLLASTVFLLLLLLIMMVMVSGGEVLGWMWAAELSHTAVQRLPRHRLEPMWGREIPGLSSFCRVRQRCVVVPHTHTLVVTVSLPPRPHYSCSSLPPVGESVEENANVVVRLLIRRPECFGPALRGEGGNGLLAAIEEAIKISEDPARDGPSVKKDRRFPM